MNTTATLADLSEACEPDSWQSMLSEQMAILHQMFGTELVYAH